MTPLFLKDMDSNDALKELLEPAEYLGYLQTMSRFSSYSWRNIYLIYKQMPNASKLADFKTWKEQYGRNIIQGSTSIKINIPIEQPPKKRLIEKIDPTTGVAVLDENGKQIMEQITIEAPVQFKQESLFDISQTKGSPVSCLAGDVMPDEALRKAFTDTLKTMALSSAEMVSYCSTINQIVLERLENITNFVAGSITYAVCQRFKVSADDMSLDFGENRIDDADTLETIVRQAHRIITAIEDRFVIICKERELDPMTLRKEETAEQQATEADISPPTEQAIPQTAPPSSPPPALTEVPVYRLSAQEAEKHGVTELYEISRQMDAVCAQVIAETIQAHKKDNNRYDLTTPAKILLEEYGRERVKWVLSKHILANPAGYSQDNLSWAKACIEEKTGSGDEKPNFKITTHHMVLDAFVNQLRTVLDRKQSFSERMRDAKKKSEAHNNSSG